MRMSTSPNSMSRQLLKTRKRLPAALTMATNRPSIKKVLKRDTSPADNARCCCWSVPAAHKGRTAPLSVTEAARQAGGATALAAGLKGAGGGALLAGVLGAIPGAILGAAGGGAAGAGKGAAVGAGIGVAAGAIAGFYESKSKTEREIIAQLGDLYLGGKLLKPGLPVNGFVFFPRGEYQGVFVVASEEPGGAIVEIYGPMVPKPPA